MRSFNDAMVYRPCKAVQKATIIRRLVKCDIKIDNGTKITSYLRNIKQTKVGRKLPDYFFHAQPLRQSTSASTVTTIHTHSDHKTIFSASVPGECNKPSK